MKTVALREAKQSLSGFVAHAQRERVLITKHGKPAALVIGVEGQDLEDVLLAQDPRVLEAGGGAAEAADAVARRRPDQARRRLEAGPTPQAEDRGAAVATVSAGRRQQRCVALSQRMRF